MTKSVFYKVTESVHNFEQDKHLHHEEEFSEGSLQDRRNAAISYFNQRVIGANKKDQPGFYAPFMSYEEAKKQGFKSFAAYSIDLWIVKVVQGSDPDFLTLNSNQQEMSFTDPEMLEETIEFEAWAWDELTGTTPPPMGIYDGLIAQQADDHVMGKIKPNDND